MVMSDNGWFFSPGKIKSIRVQGEYAGTGPSQNVRCLRR